MDSLASICHWAKLNMKKSTGSTFGTYLYILQHMSFVKKWETVSFYESVIYFNVGLCHLPFYFLVYFRVFSLLIRFLFYLLCIYIWSYMSLNARLAITPEHGIITSLILRRHWIARKQVRDAWGMPMAPLFIFWLFIIFVLRVIWFLHVNLLI